MPLTSTGPTSPIPTTPATSPNPTLLPLNFLYAETLIIIAASCISCAVYLYATSCIFVSCVIKSSLPLNYASRGPSAIGLFTPELGDQIVSIVILHASGS